MIGSKTLFTANAFVRRDHLTYTPSADPFADTPATVSQDRKLTNIGVKADVAYTRRQPQREVRRHDQRDQADENFTLGITDPDRFDVASPDAGRRLQSATVRAVRS